MNCKEATYLHTQKKEGALTLKDRISLNCHLLICGLCRLFFKETDKLENETSLLAKSDICFSASKKKEMQAAINQNSSK